MSRESAAVYRRRRLLVVLLLLLVVGGGTWAAIARPWEGDGTVPAPVVTTAPAANEEPERTSDELAGGDDADAAAGTGTTPAMAQGCEAANIRVDAVTDQESYASDQSPQLSISLSNVGDEACTMNVGSTTQSFTVNSGADVWWRSTDCQTEPADMVVTLEAGQTTSTVVPLTWDRTRSSPETCGDPGRPRAPAGGASYHLSVEIGGFVSESTTQFFLH